MHILGISAFYHDSAAALIVDGEVVAAAQEERFTRIKQDSAFPEEAIEYCLAAAGIELGDVEFVVFYDKPFLKFERLLETYLSFAPSGFRSFRMTMPVWLREKLFQKHLLHKRFKAYDPDFDWKNKLLFAEHHQSHAASAYFPSPFDEAVVLTMDGVGEWATTSVARGAENKLEVFKELHFPHSLGLLYSAFTYYTGFKVNSGEYKVMGLAPYGEPRYTQAIFDNLIDLKADGSFRLDQSFFDYCTGLRMTNDKFHTLFGAPPRDPESLLSQRDMDLAASIQAATEEVVLRMTRALASETGAKNLCLAGGVALNCVANGKVLRDGKFDNVWIQPAAGDAGGALGAALCAYHLYQNQPRTANVRDDKMQGAYLGPAYDNDEVAQRLTSAGAKYHLLDEATMIDETARSIADGKAVGWFQGRMEFGPRALGNRSILGDARLPSMQKTLNLRIKYRESFRPFAPTVRREDVADWFDLDCESPYMLIVANLLPKLRREMTTKEQALFGIEKLNVVRSKLPAITHVDYSARVQTVDADVNPRYHALITRFKKMTGCPVVANTSFNVRGEPIVCTPEDAFRCFMGTDIEFLAVGDHVLYKDEQDPNLRVNYKDQFELD